MARTLSRGVIPPPRLHRSHSLPYRPHSLTTTPYTLSSSYSHSSVCIYSNRSRVHFDFPSNVITLAVIIRSSTINNYSLTYSPSFRDAVILSLLLYPTKQYLFFLLLSIDVNYDDLFSFLTIRFVVTYAWRGVGGGGGG